MKIIVVTDFTLDCERKSDQQHEGDVLFTKHRLTHKPVVVRLHRHIRRALGFESQDRAKEQDHPLVAAES